MTTAEIIAELQKFPPHIPVMVCLEKITHSDEMGDIDIHLDQLIDRAESLFVRYEGSYVLIQSK